MNNNRDENRKHLHEIHRRAREGDLPLPESVRWIREGFGMSPEFFAEKFGVNINELKTLGNGEAGDLMDAMTRIARPFRFHISYAPKHRED